MELRHLSYFLAVAREQNITRAAEYLNISQPTLSTQMKELEEELGKQLLVRGRRRVTLTDEGMVLRRRAEEILSLVQRTEAEISSNDQTLAGDIHIGCGETSGLALIAQAARTLQDRCPGIHYSLLSGNADFVLDQLDRGLVDFGLVYGQVDERKYEILPSAISDNWGVLMRRDCPLAQKEAIGPDDLRGERLIVSQQSGARSLFGRWFSCPLERLHVVASYNLVLNASFLTRSGFGHTLCFSGLIEPEADDELCFRPLAPALVSEAHIVWKKYRVLGKACERFIRQLEEMLSSRR